MPMPTGLSGKEAVLSELIKTTVASKNADFSTKIGDNLDWLFDAIAEAVSAHVRDNLLVTAQDSTGGPIVHQSNL